MVDASALAEYLLRTPRGERFEARLFASDADLHIPALCDVEVAAVLRRYLLAGRLSAHRAAEALKDYLDLPLTRHGHQLLLSRILALRDNFSPYDACYVALAEHLGAALFTADEALTRAARAQLGLPVLGC